MFATINHTYSLDERKEITRSYRRLLRSIKAIMDPTDKINIRKAYEMAVDAHHGQIRKSGEPYILHPIEVARICAAEIGLGPTAIIAALLHDVVEDTEISVEQIEKQFGDKVAMIVEGLTKFEQLYDVTSPQAENFKKVLSTLTKDVRVVLIKMADRLHNMRTLGSMPHHKQLKIASETSYIYAPLAHRLGLYNIKTEFQDLVMKITDPGNYQYIAKKLKETKRDRGRFVSEFIKPLKTAIDKLGFPYKMFGRPKSISSIWNKIKNKGVPFEEVYDLFAVRIVLDVPLHKEKSICWEVYSIVTETHKPIPDRLKDWITFPKANGYESLHTTVVGPKGRYVEVQIRSERMDEIAEKGFAAHWKYKGVQAVPDVFDIWLKSVREILDNPSDDAVEFINDFKTNLFAEEIFVFTPNGEMKMLPKGATALDFAFNIHTDLGYHCQAVKVNNKLVPLSYKLRNGDQVVVKTAKNQKPNESWLKWVATGKAKSKIRSAMKEERKKKGEIGREALERKLRHLKINNYDDSIHLISLHLGYKNHADFYFDIAENGLNLIDVFKDFEVENQKLVLKKDQESLPPREEKLFRTDIPVAMPKGNPKLLINGESAETYTYSIANCCNPVQGDEVFGFLTAMAGIKIHRTTCPNATHLMAHYGYRIMKVEWLDSRNSAFLADLKIIGVDGIGVVQRITNVITNQLQLDMRSISMDGDEGYFEGSISVVVFNRDQLEFAIKTLQNLDGISTVTRIE
jgi:GTP diphosphokinase / guanosine-3',5'-bis(diphosphate) 3'-diphosphatase